MDYKLIAVDVDGTLTNSRKEITPRTRYALLEAQKQGKRVVIASGRQPMGVYPIARDLMLDRYNGYILSYNGGKIISCATDETVATKLFPREYLADIVSVLNDYNVTINTFDDKKIFSNSKVNDYTYIEQEVTHAEMIVCADFVAEVKFPFNKLLLAGEPLELDACQELLRKRYDGLLDIYKSAPYFLEIMPFARASRQARSQPRGADRLRRQLQRHDNDRLCGNGRRDGQRRTRGQENRQLCLRDQRRGRRRENN